MTLNILNLYPREMNIYGDYGNMLVLRKRCEWRDISTNVISHDVGDAFPDANDIDVMLGGGGQDSGQGNVQDDLRRVAVPLKACVEDGMPALVICGMYQLFGHDFKTEAGAVINGLGILDMHTVAADSRLIGNVVEKSDDFGEIIGYENHSGRTYIGGVDAQCADNANAAAGNAVDATIPLAYVTKGAGNNGSDGLEGARYKNVIGTYLHGPLLPKNPQIADWIIQRALERKYGEAITLAELDDSISDRARHVAKARPR
jgi:CobQ-like glutamine amidotransferase family enzyme